MTYGKDRTEVAVLVPNGGSLSAELQTSGKRIVGIKGAAAWTAGGLAFQALIAEPSALPKVPVFGNVVDTAGAEVVISAAAMAVANGYIAIPTTFPLVGLGRIKVRSGTNAVPVNQGADRTLILILEDVA